LFLETTMQFTEAIAALHPDTYSDIYSERVKSISLTPCTSIYHRIVVTMLQLPDAISSFLYSEKENGNSRESIKMLDI
jgi:hypothetical protein